jgi:hypothetical protein
MAEAIDYDKVTTLLLLHGEWYEVDPGTLTPIPASNFLPASWDYRFAWKSRGANSPVPAVRLSSTVIHLEENRLLHLSYKRSSVPMPPTRHVLYRFLKYVQRRAFYDQINSLPSR